MIRRLSFVVVLALAGCGSDTEITGGTPVSLDGVWTGTAQRTQGGERTCPGPTPFVLTIARFDAIVDADGRVTARAWYDSISNDLALEQSGSRLVGRITNPLECVYN